MVGTKAFRKSFALLLGVLLGLGFYARAYDGICDNYLLPSMYCSCDTRNKETTVTCWLTDRMNSTREVWRSLENVENLVTLKFMPMKPEFLYQIPSQGLQTLTSLRFLEMQQGNLTELPSDALIGMPYLQELNLDSNEISVLRKDSISGLSALKKLSLRENMLQEILAGSLVGLVELSELLLDRNTISRVEGCAFCDLQNLKDLELQNNKITDLTEYMFRGLLYLKRLDLYKNQIRILNDRVFHSLERLVELDLRENAISYIAPHAFQGLGQLQVLYLNSNQIKMLPNPVFKSLLNLKDVQLMDNSLEALNEKVMNNIPKIKHAHFMMSFKENPFKCDCGLKWVVKFIGQVKSQHLKRELAELQCRFDNGSEAVVHTLPFDCHTEYVSTTMPSATTSKPVQLVPIEIQRSDSTKTVKKNDYVETQNDSDEISDEIDVAMSDTEPYSDGSESLCASLLVMWYSLGIALFLKLRTEALL